MTAATALARVEDALTLHLRGEKGAELAEAVAVLRAKVVPKPRKAAKPRASRQVAAFLRVKFPTTAGLSASGFVADRVLTAYREQMGRDEDRNQYTSAALAQFRQNARA
jgi:hypothetical protein